MLTESYQDQLFNRQFNQVKEYIDKSLVELELLACECDSYAENVSKLDEYSNYFNEWREELFYLENDYYGLTKLYQEILEFVEKNILFIYDWRIYPTLSLKDMIYQQKRIGIYL